MTKKHFKTEAILTVTSGINLGDFAWVHELMDFLFPGIMTIGVAAMSQIARTELLRQHPSLKDLPEITTRNWSQWLTKNMPLLPKTFEIEGPLNVPNKDVEKAFSDFAKG